MTRPLLVVVGDVLVDVVIRAAGPVAGGSDTPAAITWRQGGQAANVAVAAAGLGQRVRLVGRIGDDVAGAGVRAAVAAAGPDGAVEARLAVDPVRPTGTVAALVRPGERDMYTSRGASAALAPADVAGALEGAAWVHVSGYALLHPQTRPAGLAVLEAAAAAGVGISVDPSSSGPLEEAGADAFWSWLRGPVLLTPNLDEARVLTGLGDPEGAASALAARCGEAVVTLGAEGAVHARGGAGGSGVTWARPEEVVAAGDPVGAGDAFAAGLLAARLAGEPVEGQLAQAVRAAAASVARTA